MTPRRLTLADSTRFQTRLSHRTEFLRSGIYADQLFSDETRNELGGSGTGGFNFTLTAADEGGNGGARP